MTATKYLAVMLISAVIIAGCQRKTAAEADTPKTDDRAKTEEKSNYKSAHMQKEQGYLQSVFGNKPPLEKAMQKQGEAAGAYKALYESGYEKHNAGNFSGAIADFNQCISLNPGFAEAWNLRGMSRYKTGDGSGACSDWKRAAELGYKQAQAMAEKYCR